MQLAHTLENRKVLNVFRLDFIRKRIVVFALAEATFIFRHGGSIIGQMMLVGNGLHLCGHFFDLRHFDRLLIYASRWRDLVEIMTVYDDRIWVSCEAADELVSLLNATPAEEDEA